MARWRLDYHGLKYLAIVVCIGIWASVAGYSIYDNLHAFSWGGLWQCTAHQAPNHYRAQLNASTEFNRAGAYAFGLAYAQRAIGLNSGRASGWINASTAAINLQAYHLAYEYLKIALSKWPDQRLCQNLILVCKIIGKNEEANKLTKIYPELEKNVPLHERTDE